MRYWNHAVWLSALMLLVSGCALKNPTPQTPKIQANLPKVTGIKTISDMTSVGFEWRMIPSSQIAGYRLYRMGDNATDKKLKQVAQIDDRYKSHYVDNGLKPGHLYTYQMSTYTDKGYESIQSNPVRVKTVDMIPSVSFVRAIANLPKRVKLIWRPDQYPCVKSYIIERSTLGTPDKWKKIATIKGRLNAEYMDKDLKDGEVYVYRIRIKLFNGLISAPSTAVEAITKPLPKMPTGLQASLSLPRRIHLQWQPSPTPDVVYYKVYRSPFSGAFFSYRAKTDHTSFDDMIDGDGKMYYYKVSAVDKDGLESPISSTPVMGTTLAKPSAPTITAAKVAFNHGIIFWESNDNRGNSYNVIRSHWQGLVKKKRTFANIYGNKFVDNFMEPGIKYSYRVIEVDKNGLHSEPSDSIDLIIEKKQ